MEKDEINDKIMCPAVIFAISRNLRVIGRIIILVDSIIMRNGFNHRGAPSGSIWAILFFVFRVIVLRIRCSHIGSPNDRVKIIWLVTLNIYGNIPIMFIYIIIMNIVLVLISIDFKFFLLVVVICFVIICIVFSIAFIFLFLNQNILKLIIKMVNSIGKFL